MSFLARVQKEQNWLRQRLELKRQFHENVVSGATKRDLVGDPQMRGCQSVGDVRRVQKEQNELRRLQLAKIQCGT